MLQTGWSCGIYQEKPGGPQCFVWDGIKVDHATFWTNIGNLKGERDRFKDALEKINNIRLQDKQIVDAWREARQIAFDAFDSKGEE